MVITLETWVKVIFDNRQNKTIKKKNMVMVFNATFKFLTIFQFY